MNKLFVIIILPLIYLFIVTSVSARSGCCSHHGGVVGCGCGDGTPLSSTCLPYYPECGGGGSMQNIQADYSIPTSIKIKLPTKIPTIKLQKVVIPKNVPLVSPKRNFLQMLLDLIG